MGILPDRPVLRGDSILLRLPRVLRTTWLSHLWTGVFDSPVLLHHRRVIDDVRCCSRPCSLGVVPLTSYQSATFVKARDAFQADGRSATVGRYAFGFSWGAWAALLIATALFFAGIAGGKDGGSGRRGFRRNKSVRSQRSYDLGSRRVKDEY